MIMGAAVLLAAGCGERHEPEAVPAQISIEPVITRATEVDFESGDVIGLTVTRQNGGSYAENARMTFDGGTFSGDLKWYAEGSELSDLLAYYPYMDGGFPTSYTVGTDQRGGAGRYDLMLATKRGVRPQAEPVTMEFRHQLSQVVLTVEGDGAVVEQAVLKGLLTTIDFAPSSDGTPVATASGSKADIIMEEVATGHRYRAIVVPQTMSFGVSVKTSSGGSVVEDFTEVTMQPGYSYTITAKVSAEGISFGLTGSIHAWDNGGTIEPSDPVDPEEPDYEEHDGYIVYAGTRYDTVTLSNGQTWMASPLSYVPAGYTVSDNPAEGGIWYPYSSDGKVVTVLKDEDKILEKGYLYSYDAIFRTTIDESNYDKFEGTQGICPPGWHVPARAEWYALCGASNASKYLGETGNQTDASALFWDKSAGYATVGAFIDAGFRSFLSGCIANTAYNALIVDSSVCSVEEYFGANRMAYIACSSPNSPTQLFALMTTFTSSAYPAGRVSLSFATLGKTGVQLRCIKD